MAVTNEKLLTTSAQIERCYMIWLTKLLGTECFYFLLARMFGGSDKICCGPLRMKLNDTLHSFWDGYFHCSACSARHRIACYFL
jgi:hypothetical protein